MYEVLALLDNLGHQAQAFEVQGIRVVDVYGAGHAAHEEVGVWIFPAEDGLYFHNLLLHVECFEVVRHGDEVHFGRQFVGRVTPVTVAENARLPAVYELPDFLLHLSEIAPGTFGPCRERLGYLRGFARVGLQGRHHIDPVECLQLVEVHDMVVHEEGSLHEVAHHFGVGRDDDPQCVLHGSHRTQRVYRGAHTAYASHIGPGFARVAVAHDDFDAAHHGAAAERVFDNSILYIGFNAQMTLDAGDGVYDDSFAHDL